MARNKFLTTIAGLLTNFSNRRKSQINPPTSEGYVHRQKSDGENDLTRYLTKYLKNFRNFYQSLLPSAPSENRQNPSRRLRRLMQHKLGKSFINLLQTISQLGRYLSVPAFYRLWRNFFVAYRQRTQAGFVLPVTVLMVVVILLVVTSLMFRSYQRSQQVIGAFQTQQLQNASTPAVERAKAKLERMFSDGEGGILLGPGLPSETDIEAQFWEATHLQTGEKIYQFPREKWIRLDTNGDGSPDREAGWTFETDANGDGDTTDPEDLITAYTIVFRATKAVNATTLKTVDPKLVGTKAGNTTFESFNDEKEKANNLVVSNGPILPKVEETTAAACQVTVNPDDPNSPEVNGWFSVSSAVMMKNFQVYAVSVPQGIATGQANAALSTILYQQDRTFSAGNKWGAWFRNDIEINPGVNFNWNGAIHTEGSIFTRPGKNTTFRSYLISGKNSCFYKPETNSLITARGHFVNSLLWAANSAFTGTVLVDRYSNPTSSVTLTDALDSVDNSEISGNAADLALNALKILTQNASQPRGNKPFDGIKDSKWDNQDLKERVNILQASSPPPYVDDTYRADNIYGPKPGYGRPQKDAKGEYTVIPQQKIGENLTDPELIRDVPPVLAPESYGLDGYWERRARGDGMRVIVGQRLELGNAYGWNLDLDGSLPRETPDPLNPPDSTIITNLSRQRRAQRDNLAAVQATLVYHNDSTSKGYEPVAVVATTVHPGTKTTLEKSATFEQSSLISNVYTDFFYGIGTNGWEFDPKSAKWNFADPTGNAAMKNALSNLANFAGDPDGAFPPKQENGGDIVHPHPNLTMWGNFSNLRRALAKSPASLADKTTIQTAAATLGLLAYNVDYLEKFDYGKNSTALTALNTKITDESTLSGATTADELIAQLAKLNSPDDLNLARLVHLKEQVARDREFGFKTNETTAACKAGGQLQAYGKIAEKLCSNLPKFPALYYIFPTADHGHNSGPQAQPSSEPYISNAYIQKVNPGSDRYKAINATAIADLALQPRKINFTGWALPTATSPVSGTNPVNTEWDLVLAGGNLKRVALKDSAFFDGREEMNVRALNLDLDLLRMNKVAGGSDTWLPKSGMIYAFREDAVREDAIARPRRTTYSSYETSYLTNPGVMDANNLTDPPVYNIANPAAPSPTPDDAASVGISPKPVDFYADPDRRPYGFRIKQGKDLRRNNENTVLAGLTLVSDNPVYIQGNFNGHGSTNQLTELTRDRDAIDPNDNAFYDLKLAEKGFGNPKNDPWRPAEVLADAVTLLSGTFCDGSVEDAYRLSNKSNPSATDTDLVSRYGCVDGAQYTSYLSQNRPKTDDTVPKTWARENSVENDADTSDGTSPILFSRNGVAMVYNSTSTPPNTSAYNSTYNQFSDLLYLYTANTHGRKTPMVKSNAWVNVVMVSGNVPSRNDQGNGGLHNFPRLLERWQNITLKIRGSFIQLNFSNYATSPFERDAWEPRSIGNNVVTTTMQGAFCNGGNPCKPVPGTSDTSNNVNIMFYFAPNRDWGYDVGLQYMPSGPVSKRLVIRDAPRSEFYREPKASDPYICQLRKAINFPCNP